MRGRLREGYGVVVVVEQEEPDWVGLNNYISGVNLPLVMLVSTAKYSREEVWEALTRGFRGINREKSMWV
jgi:hypothetical protein